MSRVIKFICFFVCILGVAVSASLSVAHARGFSIIYRFSGGKTDGSQPAFKLAMDASGNLYGVTQNGGAHYNCKQFAGYGPCGTVFKVAPGGQETVLYSFCPTLNYPVCTDAAPTISGLILDEQGNLYGEAQHGGNKACNTGCGTVFKIASDGTETTLYTFCQQTNCVDGWLPYGGLVMDQSGNLYGVTQSGGAYGYGEVFELASNGTENVLYSFCSGGNPCIDGAGPSAALVMDQNGNLYGTASKGGAAGLGAVFELQANGTYSLLHSFQGGSDGATPLGELIMDSSGNLLGTTYNGGAANAGTVFKVDQTGAETVPYTFCSQYNCADGSFPKSGLVLDEQGNLYGTTLYGGLCAYCGTIFEIAASGSESVLHDFCTDVVQYCKDGYEPLGSLILNGNILYGTAQYGGDARNCTTQTDHSCGMVFRARK